MVQENIILSLDKSSSAIAVMLPFSSASSAADLATKHCYLKKMHPSKYVVANFTHNNMEYIITRKTSMSPSHGDLQYLSYHIQ